MECHKKRIFGVLFVKVLISFSFSFVYAQHETYYKFTQITADNGLADNSINTIQQDDLGFIWIGTEYGLSRYDAYSIRNYRYSSVDSTSLSNNYITCIIKDSVKGNLWIGTQDGLNYYNKSTDAFTRFLHSTDESVNYVINDLFLSEKQGLIAATNIGLVMYNTNRQRLLNGLDNIRIYGINDLLSVHEDTYGRIWIGTRNGLKIFHPFDNTFMQPDLTIDRSSPLYIYDITEDSQNNILLSTRYHGLLIIENGELSNISQFSRETVGLMGNWINTTIEKAKGEYWLSVRDGGLARLNVQTNDVQTYLPDKYDPYNINDLNSKALTMIHKDLQGNLWIGTYNNGVNLLDINKKSFRHYRVTYSESGLRNNNIRALFQDSEGYIWIGTKEDGGLSRFIPEYDKFIHYEKNPDNPYSINDDYVFAIEEYNRDILLIGTYRGGLNAFNKRTQRFFSYKHLPQVERSDLLNAVYSICKDSKGRVWVGTLKNLCLFDFKSKSYTIIDSIFEVNNILEDSKGRLWFASAKTGLLYFNESQNTFEKWNYRNLLEGKSTLTRINHLYEDSRGGIWMATGESGAVMINPETNKITSFDVSDGLPTNQTYAILEDNHLNIWVSTANGLSRIDRYSLDITNFESFDGLQGGSFSRQICLKLVSGELIFGGSNGFHIFQPGDIEKNMFVPPVYITDFKVANLSINFKDTDAPLSKPIWQTKSLTLKHDQADITFEFAALNYSTPEKNQYAYKLEGFDDDWVPAGKDRRAIYTNLDPGRYSFNVIASNNDGVWNDEGTSLQITILKPFWNTWIAYLIYATALFIILNAIFRYVKLKERFRKNLLKERLQRRKEEELHQLKLQFFTNISHEFRTPLTLISGPLQQLLSNHSIDMVVRNKIQMVYRNAQALLQQINQLMDFRKIETNNVSLYFRIINIKNCINEQITAFSVLAAQKQIQIKFKITGNQIFAQVDIEKFNSVLNNLLSNAIKYSARRTIVEINLIDHRVTNHFDPDKSNRLITNNSENNNDFIEISIEDNGPGIMKDDLEKIFERYFRAGSSKHDHNPGSGIGLAVVKNYIEMHNGNIIAESTPGEGTRFTIHIPKKASKVSTNNSAQSIWADEKMFPLVLENSNKEMQKIEAAGLHGNKPSNTILIVEDNEDMLLFLEDAFSRFYNVLKAKNGIEGFQVASTYMPDIIVSDIMMPGSDGIELCQKIKTHQVTSHIPVILLTAKTSVENRITGFETGADAYISKPFEIRLLQVQVKSLIQQRMHLKKIFSRKIEVIPGEITATSLDEIFLSKVLKLVEDNISNPDLGTEILCNELNISRSNLHNKLKALTDQSTTEFIRTIRLKRAAQLLSTGGYNVNDVVFMVGFTSPSYFTKCFKGYFKQLPNQYAKEKGLQG